MKAAIDAQVSTNKQELQNQFDALRAFAQKRGYIVSQVLAMQLVANARIALSLIKW
jgi:DNA invertase Pin-like site-specific DNA recombinase